MKYEMNYNITGYGKKGKSPFQVMESLDAKQQYDDFLYELRKAVRVFVKELLSKLEDSPFRVTLYCTAKENYISFDNEQSEFAPNLPKGTPLIDFWDVLLEVLEEIEVKYEVFLSPHKVSNHFIIQIISIQ